MAEPEPDADEWLTLTQAALRTGYTRDAILERIRQGQSPATLGDLNTAQISLRGLLEPPRMQDFPNVLGEAEKVVLNPAQIVQELTMDILRTALHDLRTAMAKTQTDLTHSRATLESALNTSAVDRGRAERAEAHAAAVAERAERAEARLTLAEVALAEAQTPWPIRVLKAFRA